MDEELSRRVSRLEAFEAVRAVLTRYARACDELSIESLRDLLCEDATLTGSSSCDGRPAVLDYYASVFDTLSAARHHIVNSELVIESPDRVAHRGYYVALLVNDERTVLAFGDYRDVLVRDTDGEWRFREKGNFGATSMTLPA